jgi:hypothetical protein
VNAARKAPAGAGKAHPSKASEEDFGTLRRTWASRNYRMWLLKSMRIRQAFASGECLDEGLAEWLADYPPRMNREYFVDFTCMLCWSLLKSGRTQECADIFGRIRQEYGYLKFVQRLEAACNRGKAGADLLLWKICAVSGLKQAARNVLFEARTAARNI